MASSDTTTVKISRDILSHLERLKEEMRARSIDETVRALIKDHRRRILAGAFGADKGRVKPFTENDRGEDR
ncbi:MAG TPA: VapB-type antitoxin [Candidatus Dormibacteraeota bacterium]|nr:VapB-type antitoxin [Candidatus Dormibacteraeota bacterium]